MNRILQGKPPLIYGDGKQMRDFSYYTDCVKVIAEAGWRRAGRNDVFNIGPDEDPVTLNEVARLVVEITGYRGKPRHIPARPGEVKFAWCSSNKARRKLGYRTTVHLEEGVERMWAWAKPGGPRAWKYLDSYEIENKYTPAVWRKKAM
jgi:UDP-glucose 4-epimerase